MRPLYNDIEERPIRIFELDQEGYVKFPRPELATLECEEMLCWRDGNGHRDCSERCAAFQLIHRNKRTFALCRALDGDHGAGEKVIGVLAQEAPR